MILFVLLPADYVEQRDKVVLPEESSSYKQVSLLTSINYCIIMI